MRYDVVLVGFRLNAAVKPARALEMVLGLDEASARELTRRFPSLVLEGVGREQAERIADDLTDAGGKVEVRESQLGRGASTQPVARGAGPAPASMPNDYAIGDILPPERRPVPVPPPPAPARPSTAQRAVSSASSLPSPDGGMASLLEPTRTPEAPPSAFGPGVSIENDLAFAGMQSFDEGLQALDPHAAPVDVDPQVLRAIRERPYEAPAPRASLGERWRRLLASLGRETTSWLLSLLALTVISTATLFAVGYAIDPDDPLGAVGLGRLRGLLPAVSGS